MNIERPQQPENQNGKTLGRRVFLKKITEAVVSLGVSSMSLGVSSPSPGAITETIEKQTSPTPLERFEECGPLEVWSKNPLMPSNQNDNLSELTAGKITETSMDQYLKLVTKADKEPLNDSEQYIVERIARWLHTKGNTARAEAERNLLSNFPEYQSDPELAWRLLEVCFTRKIRRELLKTADKFLAEGKLSYLGLEPLSPQETNWCTQEQVHHVTLASAKVANKIAKNCLETAPDIWLDGLEKEERNNYLYSEDKSPVSWPQPEILAKLEQQETSSGAYLGDVPYFVSTNTKKGFFPTSKPDIIKIAKLLEKSTNLPYTTELSNGRLAIEYIPSSIRGNTKFNTSGGAIMGQFMPIHLLHLLEKYEATRLGHEEELPILHPNTPLGSMALKALYLYGCWNWRQGKEDGGYWIESRYPKGGGLQNPGKALRTWNPSTTEIKTILGSLPDHNE